MRLLITGAAGFIGRNALLAVPHSWEVVALYRQRNTGFLSFLETHQLRHIQPVVCDLTDIHQVKQAVDQVGSSFDGCLALASNTSIPVSVEHPVYDLTTNAIGLIHLLQCCTIDHLVYLSSGAVYIGLSGLVGPASAVFPTFPYAISKLAAEHYIRAFISSYQKPRYATIVRFFGSYGPYEPFRKFYTKLVRRFAFERNPQFTVVGDGENYIDAMYVDDAIKALFAVLSSPPDEGFRCIDLGKGSSETINSVVKQAAHTFGLEPQLSHEGTIVEYIRFVIDPKPFTLAYHFTPQISLEEGLRRLASHIEEEEKTSS